MLFNEPVYSWLVYSALLSLAVLALGSGAVLLCRQPARRLRIIELSLAGCLLAPLLGMIPGYPQWGIAWLVPQSRTSVAHPTNAPVILSKAKNLRATDHTVISGGILRYTPDDMVGVSSGPIAEPAETPASAWDVGSWLVRLYLLGVAIGVAWWLLGMAVLVRIVWTAKIAPPRYRQLLAEIAGRRSTRVQLLTSRLAKQPFASVGVTVQLPSQRSARHRAVIVLPESLCDDERAVRWALAHEWTHIEHRDFRAWFLAGLARVLLFYQPLMWWLRRQLRLCQDYVADARASRQAQPEDYAEFLAIRATVGSLHPAMVGLGIGFGKSELYRRVIMLVQNRSLESRPPRLWTIAVTCAALLLVTAIAALTISPQAAAEAGPPSHDSAAASFTAKLPDGVTVELLGMSTHPSNEKSWWRPDGSPLAEPPCDTLKGSVSAGAADVVRELAVQLHGLPAETVGTAVKFEPAYISCRGVTPTRHGKTVSGLEAMIVSLPDQPSVTVRVGIAAGPWQTVYENERGAWSTRTMKGTFVVSPIIEKDSSITVTVAYNIVGPESRLVAVGQDGLEHSANYTSKGDAADFQQITAIFSGISLKDIKAFRLQTCPYRWVDFHNISLKAGQETAVQILQSWKLADGTKMWGTHTSTQTGGLISDEELDEAIKEKKYKVLSTFDSINGEKQYVYSLTLSDDRSVGRNFSMRLEDLTSLDDYWQKQAKQQEQRRDRINQAIATGRIRLLNVDMLENHICQDVNSGIKFKVQRIRHADGKEIAFPRPDYGKIPTAVKETSWQEHLQAIRDGNRRLLDVESVKSYTYEMTADDGTKEIFNYGGGKPLLQKIMGFSTSNQPITKDGITIEQGVWHINAVGTRTVRLFEIPNPTLEDCRVIYRAKLKSENLEGRAYLEMWCRMPGGGEFFSKVLSSVVQGTTDWATCETPFFLKKGQRPDLIKLNLVVEGKAGMIAEGKGTVWIKDVELLKGPLLEK